MRADPLQSAVNSNAEEWMAYWRDVLVMVAGMMTPRNAGSSVETTPVYVNTQWVREGIPTPQGRVLFLRLLAAIQERATRPAVRTRLAG